MQETLLELYLNGSGEQILEFRKYTDLCRNRGKERRDKLRSSGVGERRRARYLWSGKGGKSEGIPAKPMATPNRPG